jgi:beta-xylosidase
MRSLRYYICFLCLLSQATPGYAQEKAPKKSGNPIFPGWYADPEAKIFKNTYWVFPTYSGETDRPGTALKLSEAQLKLQKNTINAQYLKQTFLDAFSSNDLVHWKKHPQILDIKNVAWAAYSIWAPSITEKDGKYYLFFGANDIQSDDQLGGIGVAVSNSPGGPFIDHLGKPLIDKFHNGAQPIDQFVFKDTDGQYYLFYGGWKHCNVAKLNDDFTGFKPFEDGTVFKSITPDNFVEGVFMIKRNGKYYLMWSEGGWTGPDYSVAYAIADSPTGPFKRIGKILQQDPEIATGAGHHSVINIPGTDDWYIFYHRRPLNTTNGNHRETCVERMYFDEKGFIKPVKITNEGVQERKLPASSKSKAAK